MVRKQSNGADGEDSSASPRTVEENSSDGRLFCDKNLSQGGRMLDGPVILIHGWGTKLVVSMKKLQNFLEEEGIPKGDIFEPSYPYLLSLERIKNQLSAQLEEIDRKYPPATKYTFITHSLGQFVALYTILEGEWQDRVKKIVSLGGFAHGQNKKPGICLGNVCGPVWSHLTPHKNEFLESIYKKHANVIAGLDICSVSLTHDDKINNPTHAGEFDNSQNVHIDDKQFSHSDLVRTRKIFQEMMKGCFRPQPSICSEAN